MHKEWVDFQAVKAAVDLQMVLDHYAVTGLKQVGGELRGPCPIHRGGAKSKHLSVNLSKSAFKCFFARCGARGNVLDFVAAMEGCSVRDAALKLQDWFRVGDSKPLTTESAQEPSEAFKVKRGIYKDPEGALYEAISEAASPENFEPVVVYRELFGDFRFWVVPRSSFSCDARGSFALVKLL